MQWISFMIIGSLISVLGGGLGPIIDTRYANLIKNGLLYLWFGLLVTWIMLIIVFYFKLGQSWAINAILYPIVFLIIASLIAGAFIGAIGVMILMVTSEFFIDSFGVAVGGVIITLLFLVIMGLQKFSFEGLIEFTIEFPLTFMLISGGSLIAAISFTLSNIGLIIQLPFIQFLQEPIIQFLFNYVGIYALGFGSMFVTAMIYGKKQ